MNNGDIVKINENFYVVLEDIIYDINGGGYLENSNHEFEIILHIGPALDLFLNKKIYDLENKLKIIKDTLE